MAWSQAMSCQRGFARKAGARPPGEGERGAVMVEFAFALMFIFLVFIAYINLSEIFLAHERLRYATNVASRAHSVGGSASNAASKIDKGYELKTEGKAGEEKGGEGSVSMSKKIDLPEAVGKLWGEKDGFTIYHKVKTYMEPKHSGDNKVK